MHIILPFYPQKRTFMFVQQTMDIDSLISRLVHAKSVDSLKKDVGSLRSVKPSLNILSSRSKNSLLFEFAFLPIFHG